MSHLALNFPLHGSQLIEASAGTGKTFTISALYLRLVLQHQSPFSALVPPQILVVTFTDAATLELRDRIRTRLVEALRVFRGEPTDDALLRDLRAAFAEEQWPQCAQRLEIAAQWMDEAAVSTIHSWCQRMLREHAFDSGSLFEQVVNTHQEDLLAQVVRDYWRQQCYALQGEHLQWVEQQWQSPSALLGKLKPLLEAPISAPLRTLHDEMDSLQASHLTALSGLKEAWKSTHLAVMRDVLQTSSENKWFHGNKLGAKVYTPRLELLQRWCDGDALQIEHKTAADYFARFSVAGFEEALAKKAPVERIFSPEMLAALDSLSALLQHNEALSQLNDPLLRHAAGWVKARFDREKRQRAEIDFNDMLTRLDAALQGDNGEQLAHIIRAQFPVAMIDEFQDTDPVQYRIFDRVYGIASNPQSAGLFLIGDPKQAIYSFRGADIHTYLHARDATHNRHHALDTNYRSTPELVEAINRLFSRAEQHPQGAFLFKKQEENRLPFAPVQANPRTHILQIEGKKPAALTFWTLEHSTPLGLKDYRTEMAQRCASEVARVLQRAHNHQAGLVDDAGTLTPLHAADIAILVRGAQEAALVRRELSLRGVRSVYLSERDSVLESTEAHDLLLWLRACAEPEAERHVRAALASQTLGFELSALERLNQDETHWEEWVMRFRDYRRLWWQQGVLPMLHRFLHDLQLPQTLTARPNGERVLTNLLHLAELLQQDAATLDGEQALIRYFSERLAEHAAEAKEKLIRLESDERLVRVVTVHKSKGLEYPLVFLPFVCSFKQAASGKYGWLPDENGQRRCVLLDAANKEKAEQERLREDVRLLYVALTRAKYACWAGVANVSAKQGHKTQLHQSALGYLLGGGVALGDAGVAEWLNPLCQETICEQQPAPDVTHTAFLAPERAETLCYRTPARRAAEHWWIASYSALVLDAGKIVSTTRADDTSPERAAVQYLTDDDTAAALPGSAPMESGLLGFPRGPVFGSFLHALLEVVGREGFAASVAKPDWLRRQVERSCARRNLTEWHGRLSEWLLERLSHPLPLGDGREVALTALRGYQVEMEFSFHVHKARLKQIDELVCAQLLPGLARQPLAEETLNGLFKGFIDLAFEHEGRYYVADYKSNWLGVDEAAYEATALNQALMRHRYDLQGLFYLVALHRQLRVRLPHYDYEQHMGGVLFVFLRGSAATGQGVWAHRPSRAFVEALDALLSGSRPSSQEFSA